MLILKNRLCPSHHTRKGNHRWANQKLDYGCRALEPSGYQGQGGGHQLTPVRYAVIGAGLAGVAVAWHLLRLHKEQQTSQPVHLHMFEAWGIASGGSGAAAGLLHPFSPKGKLLWKGAEAFAAALDAVKAAEAAHAQSHGHADMPGEQPPTPFVWRNGMVCPAASLKQAMDFNKAAATMPTLLSLPGTAPQAAAAGATAMKSTTTSTFYAPPQIQTLSEAHLDELIPGITKPSWIMSSPQDYTGSQISSTEEQPAAADHNGHRKTSRRHRTAANAAAPSCTASAMATAMPPTTTLPATQNDTSPMPPAGVWISGGVVLDVHKYLHSLWDACGQLAEQDLPAGSQAVFHQRALGSLRELVDPVDNGSGQPGWSAVVVAAGAAACALPELQGCLPMRLCQGYTVVMRPDKASTLYPPHAPSILGSTYLSSQEAGGQLIIGATRLWGLTPEQALQCGAPENRSVMCTTPAHDQGGTGATTGNFVHGVGHVHDAAHSTSCDDASALRPSGQDRSGPAYEAAEQLREAGAGVWSPLGTWHLHEVRSGVRALPPRTQAGALPLLGRLNGLGQLSRHEPDGDSVAVHPALPPVWVCVGLGSRGLVYHAYVARQLAQAVVSGDEGKVMPELRAWKRLMQERQGQQLMFDSP